MSTSLFQILNISKQDLIARLQDLDVTSNNLANVNTKGYRAQRSDFQELLEQQQLSGTFIKSTQIMPNQGATQTTENPLDIMVNGDGFFSVKLPGNQVGYTRNGAFTQDENGTIVDGHGHQLIWNGALPTNTDEVRIDKMGAVFARVGTTWSQAGAIPLTRFTNPTALGVYGESIYTETVNSGKPMIGAAGSQNYGIIMSQALEQSNVDMGTEMTRMIELQRTFQMSVRTFQQTDTMISQAIHMRKG
jgi:flagellar basal-body rod protein FlgG